MYGDFPVERVPLFQPKGYVPKAGAGHRMDGVPQPKDMFRSAVKFISPVAYHPGDPGKNVSQNVLSVELGALYHNVELATGDPVRCEKCGAIFCASDAPSLTKADDDDSARCWTCKYCGTKQQIEIEDAEIPQTNVSEYVIVPGAEQAPAEAAAAAADGAAAAAPDDDCYVVFCVDVSGSMNMTSKVNDKYISKLACVAGAVYAQMDALRHEHPNRRVCLVTFGSDFDVFNGTEHKRGTGVILSDWDAIVKFTDDIQVDQPVSAIFDALAEEVIYLQDRGCTALGPALLASITIASRKRGSYVVLCTDGMANQGIGSLENVRFNKDDTEKSEIELLYDKFGETAKDAGVTVSVIGIKGAECRMENLGAVADATGGSVDLAEPGNLDFSGTIEEPILASRVSVIVRVDPAFIFENGTNALAAEVGNVKRITQHQCVLFSSPDDKIKPPSEVRLQCEITFTMTNGAQHLRVVEKVIPFKADVREAVDGINVQLVGGYVSRTAAKMAHDGEVEAAGVFSQGYQDKLQDFYGMQRHATVEQREMLHRYRTQNAQAQCMVQSSLCQQRASGMSNFSAARNRDDFTSANIYQMRSDAGSQQCLIM